MQQPQVTRHHPFFSALALLGVVLLLVGLGIVLVQSGGQAFSPGPLSAVSATAQQAGGVPHHAAAGDNCLNCHTPFVGVTAARCTTCHGNIAEMQQMAQGLHGQLNDLACTTCHQEHQGAGVDLQARALNQFSAETHAAFFTLAGAHTDLDCESCHENGQFAGTPITCAGCHAEPERHAGQFGIECALCHTTAGWESAELFAHAFPLDHGQLGPLQCATCHTMTYVEFSCTACHEPGYESEVDRILSATDRY